MHVQAWAWEQTHKSKHNFNTELLSKKPFKSYKLNENAVDCQKCMACLFGDAAEMSLADEPLFCDGNNEWNGLEFCKDGHWNYKL